MSWIEVECKLKISNPSGIRKKINEIADYKCKEKKVDDYYALTDNGYPSKSLRIRDKGKSREVNFKERISYKKGVWAKKEVEFKVSDINNFFNLLNNFGFKKWIRKEKRTELYKTKDGVSIELNNVKGLGWFVEIEKLCKANEVSKARDRIVEIRKKLAFPLKDFPSKMIEKKGYTKDLWKLKN